MHTLAHGSTWTLKPDTRTSSRLCRVPRPAPRQLAGASPVKHHPIHNTQPPRQGRRRICVGTRFGIRPILHPRAPHCFHQRTLSTATHHPVHFVSDSACYKLCDLECSEQARLEPTSSLRSNTSFSTSFRVSRCILSTIFSRLGGFARAGGHHAAPDRVSFPGGATG
jgi:hypothetical protein